MKCSKCNREWTIDGAGDQIRFCPYCGAPLAKESDVEKDAIIKVVGIGGWRRRNQLRKPDDLHGPGRRGIYSDKC